MIAATLESEHGNLVDLLKMINSETHSPHERNLLVLMEDQWLNWDSAFWRRAAHSLIVRLWYDGQACKLKCLSVLPFKWPKNKSNIIVGINTFPLCFQNTRRITSSHGTLSFFHSRSMAAFLRWWSAATVTAYIFELSFAIASWRRFPFCCCWFSFPSRTGSFIRSYRLRFGIRVGNFAKNMLTLSYSCTGRASQFSCCKTK